MIGQNISLSKDIMYCYSSISVFIFTKIVVNISFFSNIKVVHLDYLHESFGIKESM